MTKAVMPLHSVMSAYFMMATTRRQAMVRDQDLKG